MVNNLDPARLPGRRPWLLSLIVAVLGVTAWLRYASPRAAAPASVERAAPAVAEPVPPARSEAVAQNAAGTGEVVSAPLPAAAAGLDQRRAELEAMVSQDRLQEARTNGLSLLKEPLTDADRAIVEQQLGMIDISLVTTPRQMPEKEDYLVARGDSMDKIAKQFGSTVALLQKSNERTNSLIKPGDRLRVFNGRFAITVNKTRKELLVTMNGEFFKRYAAGTGRYGKTPAGTYVISDKIVEPVWWRPDGKEIPFGNPENILGTRWLALRATGATLPVKGYGIHGTWDDASVGKAESAGCVRLKNQDVEELFDLMPLETPVAITE